jgi:multicomponent Na+:H+ antiporter subunit C
MTLILAIVTASLFATGVYNLMRRSFMRLMIGIILLGQGATLLVFSAAGLVQGKPALIDEHQTVLTAGAADPLPQALVLTAIVISFGLIAFLLALLHRVYQSIQQDDFHAFPGRSVE